MLGPLRLSIAHGLLALMVITTGAVTAALAAHFQLQLAAEARDALEHKAAVYGRLVGREVAPAIASGDPELARAIFDAVAADGDIDSLVLMTGAGATLHTRGAPHGWIEAAREGVDELAVINLGERLAVVAPVAILNGPRGTLIIELSTRGLREAKDHVKRTAAWAGLGALALEVLLACAVARAHEKRSAATERAAVAAHALRASPDPLLDTGPIDLGRVELPRAVANTNAGEDARPEFSPPVRKRA
jgi:hypothetical protein